MNNNPRYYAPQPQQYTTTYYTEDAVALAASSKALGILSIICIIFFSVLGIILGAVALAKGCRVSTIAGKDLPDAVAGRIYGVFGLVFSAIITLVAFITFLVFFEEIF